MAAVAFSPDDETLVAGDSHGAAWRWDLSTPSAPRQLGEPLDARSGDAVMSVAFSPDGTTLAAGDSGDGTGDIGAVAFSPTGNTLVTANEDGTVTVWDVAGPRRAGQAGPAARRRLPGPRSSRSAQRGPSWPRPDSDGTVGLWDLAGLAQAGQLGGALPLPTANDESPVWVSFSPDNRTLAAGNQNGTMTFWNLCVNAAISRACAVASGALTARQWAHCETQAPYQPPCPGGS